MKMMGNLALGSSFGGVTKGGSGNSAPIGGKKGLGSQSGSLKNDDDNASMSEMSTTSFDTTQATDEHDGQERTVNLSSIVITDVVTVAQILKMVLRDLPEPVVTFSTFDALMSICLQLETKAITEEKWDEEILSALKLMPTEHKETLDFLIRFLSEVAAMSDLNSMDISNLASIFSPTLMRPLIESINLEDAFREVRRSQNILKLLLNYEKLKSIDGYKYQSIITDELNVQEMSLGFDSYASQHASLDTEYSPVLSSNTSPVLNITSSFTPPLSPRLSNSNYKPLLSDRIQHRKRPNNRPISVSLDSSILPSLQNSKDKMNSKLSPINENNSSRDDFNVHTKNLEDFAKIKNSTDNSIDGGDENESLEKKGRNSMGTSGMKSLPVRSGKPSKTRPMSTSAGTSTSLSYFLKMFMSNKDEKNEKVDVVKRRSPSFPPSTNKRITSLPKKVDVK
eukprot:CAMPEP_0119034248 /NCGR_PEP_ID=MMETSP1177-20130426/1253_1 /TAXON_ID=2985 /ORGANISM="Ochromonas sp, Strain CCMP1899" /LENGTH=451 /DNA_ID=CAMNT_0006991551 /DNA_START=1539 /DNA_END=2894 /DNA_ORIENTATION=+